MFGHRVLGMDCATARQLAADAGLGDAEVENHTSFTSLFWDAGWLELQCTYSRVTRVHLGALSDPDSGDYIWPDPVPLWEDP